MKLFIPIFFFIVLLTESKAQTNMSFPYKSGEDVINAMYKTYSGKWYKNFTFSQETHFIKNDKEEKMEVWHEVATFPGKLLIKFATKDSKNGLLFADQIVYGFTEGKQPVSRPMIHDLLLAAFDIYFLKPVETVHIFDSLGYNLKIVRPDIFEGRKMIVVGAEKNDSTSRQFWIDEERLYLQRIIYSKGTNVTDCTFGDYQKINDYWVAKKIIFKQNGKLSTIENYFDIKFPKELNSDVFDPKKFNEVKLN